MKHDAAMAKKSLMSSLILAGEQQKQQQEAEQDRAATLDKLLKAGKVAGIGAGILALLYIVLMPFSRKRAAPVAGPTVIKANRRRYRVVA